MTPGALHITPGVWRSRPETAEIEAAEVTLKYTTDHVPPSSCSTKFVRSQVGIGSSMRRWSSTEALLVIKLSLSADL